MVQAVWPGLLGGRVWFRLCGQGLVSCLDGSARVLVSRFRLCGRGLVSCLDGSCPGSKSVGSGCMAGV